MKFQLPWRRDPPPQPPPEPEPTPEPPPEPPPPPPTPHIPTLAERRAARMKAEAPPNPPPKPSPDPGPWPQLQAVEEAQAALKQELAGMGPPPTPPTAQEMALRRIAEHAQLVEALGAQVAQVINQYPLPPDTVVYVLEMLKANVVQQAQKRG